MKGSAHITAWVDQETKQRFGDLARAQDMSESALLKQLLAMVVRGEAASLAGAKAAEPVNRDTRISVRLRGDDRMLLQERAAGRAMKPATYVSALVRAHLRSLAPLPKKEFGGLMQAVNQLGSLGRNLNQIARAIHQGGRPNGPSRDDLREILRACGGLRDHVRELLAANMKAWEAGYETRH